MASRQHVIAAGDALPDFRATLGEDAVIVGVDEAGRGPLAGDVVAAAVILDAGEPLPGLDDSKKLSERQRESLASQLERTACAFSLGRASPAEIDTLNILKASLLAMQRAVEGLGLSPDLVLVDGHQLPAWHYRSLAVIRGDARVAEISAASILAKVTRDREMVAMHREWPEYGFETHKGYPTKQHRQALRQFGACPIHRKSYAPVREVL